MVPRTVLPFGEKRDFPFPSLSSLTRTHTTVPHPALLTSHSRPATIFLLIFVVKLSVNLRSNVLEKLLKGSPVQFFYRTCVELLSNRLCVTRDTSALRVAFNLGATFTIIYVCVQEQTLHEEQKE